MCVLKLKPAYKDYLWGGHRLVERYNKEYDGEILAESWELSCHPDGKSVIAEGPWAGKTLEEYIRAQGKGILGENCRRFRDFPVLIKFIDAKQDLSIQVHPDNRYALKHEGQYGKTEMWYVVEAGPGAFLYYGFQREISREEFAQRIRDDTLTEVLHKVPVQKGDMLFIEAGTIHAIGKDILIAEIQQNSNVTYRVYDYGRVGKDGKKRDLHIEKALAVTNRVPLVRAKNSYPHVADCDYFTVDKLNLDGKMMDRMEGGVSEESFVSILVLDGEGTVACGKDGEQRVTYRKGDSLFLTAGSGRYVVEGRCDALVTTIRSQSAPVRIGIDIGGTNTKIGLVDVHHRLIDTVSILTKAERDPEDVIADVGKAVQELLDQNHIPLDACMGAGVGMPGTVDRERGCVRYSNNIPWENVPLAEELGEILPVPVAVANDADCAALGEAVAGAGKDVSDMVMVTLGTGVGGGVILGGRLFCGRLTGGCELGHMAIYEGGELCTCGRRGCLEAYVSATALIRDAERAALADPDSLLWELCGGEIGKLDPEMVFAAAEQKDPAGMKLTDDYVRHLGTGIVNIVNLFRPEAVLLGGGISAQGTVLTDRLNSCLKAECFGGEHGQIPEVRTAKLGNLAGMIGAAALLVMEG